MADSYLTIAEQILAEEGRDMSAAEIIDAAREAEILPQHLYGPRQDKTLQARLSEDIAQLGFRSRFLRISPGRYFLREAAENGGGSAEYYARPRRKELRNQDILTLEGQVAGLSDADGVVSLTALSRHIKSGRYSYRRSEESVDDEDAIALHSFVVVHDDNERVLSFRYGKFFPQTDPLYGRRSIGLASPVSESDLDLTFPSFFGVVEAGARDLSSGIGLTRGLAEEARYGGEIKPWIGILTARTSRSPAVIHVVLTYSCPPAFRPTKKALSVNDIRWLDLRNPLNDIGEYDSTSAILLTRSFAREMVTGKMPSPWAVLQDNDRSW